MLSGDEAAQKLAPEQRVNVYVINHYWPSEYCGTCQVKELGRFTDDQPLEDLGVEPIYEGALC